VGADFNDGVGPVESGLRPLVMLVEDDQAITEVYRLGLEAAGFRVCVFADASGLFQALDEETPDIAVLDWHLGGIVTGLDILENLRLDRRTADVPVLMLSNHLGDLDGALDRALHAGAQEWLVKIDTTPAKLAASLREALARAARSQSVAAKRPAQIGY
jgi:DNA-binding response OmpR family regulator